MEETRSDWRPEEADIVLPNGHVYRFRRPPTRAITEMGLIVMPSKMREATGETVAETLPDSVQRQRYETDLRANDAMRAFFRRYCTKPEILPNGAESVDSTPDADGIPRQVCFDRSPAEGDEDLLFEPLSQRFFRPRGAGDADDAPKPGGNSRG